MAQQEIDIGVEGNDGTGDSIRESFNKVNENFQELYAVFGIGGQISFTDLSDTPNSYIGNENKIPIVNSTSNTLEFREIASNNALDGGQDSIGVDFSIDGKIILRQLSNRVALDTAPELGGPLNAGANPIANISVTQNAINIFNSVHGTDLTIDDLVIDKKFADSNYQRRITVGGGVRLEDEPTDVSAYILIIESFTTLAGDAGGNTVITAHGLSDDFTGAAYEFASTSTMPTATLSSGQTVTLTNGGIYYTRIVDANTIALYQTKDDALLNQNKLFLTGGTGTLTLTDVDYDENLEGNWLSSFALPRKSVVRRQGDTMEGILTLSDHPGILQGAGTPNGPDDLQAVTKLYVDSLNSESQINLYVSTSGDDRQPNTPAGSEGRSSAYAFRTVNAACRKAEELMIASSFEPGPYRQLITYDNGRFNSAIITAGVQNPITGRGVAKNALELNKTFIEKEVTAFVNQTYPNFDYDVETYERDLGLILDSIGLDIMRGDNANYLSRWAGLKYYGSVAGQRIVGQQKQQIKRAIEYAKEIVLNYILTNTSLTSPFQTRFSRVEASVTNMDSAAITAVSTKFDVILNIVENGVFDADPVRDGSTQYKINITNGNLGAADQAQTGNVDIIPGKVIMGKSSGAIGRIINYVTGDQSNEIYDYALIELLEPIEFEPEEDLEYGNIVKEKQISIKIESGIYEEDFPIRVSQNVSIKGDEFRRCLIRPRNRLSQSPVNDIFFYRDNKFDNLVLGRSDIGTIGSYINAGANANRTSAQGVYTLTDTDYITNGIGTGAVFEATVAADGSVTVVVDELGTGFAPGDIVTLPDSDIGASGEDSVSFEILSVPNGVAYVNPLTNTVDGHFGRHYLENPGSTRNTGPGTNNAGNWTSQSKVLLDNKEFIKEQINEYLKSTYPAMVGQYIVQDLKNRVGKTVDAIVADLRRGGLENSLELQGVWYGFRTAYADYLGEITAGLTYLGTLCGQLIQGNVTTTYGVDLTYPTPDLFYGNTTPSLWQTGVVYSKNDVVRYQDGVSFIFIRSTTTHISGSSLNVDELANYWTEISSPTSTITSLIGLIVYAYNVNYNPPKNNRDLDVFLMNDGTILRNITVQGQGGFMCVLDPEGQILTRSPYIQTGSSFSQSLNKQAFRGGLFVDAFCGNSAANVTTKSDAFTLQISSLAGQGLFVRRPETPCAFYLDGRRFQVNSVTQYDPAAGTATLILDPTSNGGAGFTGTTSLIVGEGIDLDDLSTPVDITLQTAGNRSMLGNDFTQINDLGYGLVCVNGGLSEMVSMFTYYCWTSYYSKNGSEIRSLTGSSCYGEYGLVAEGADPNEVPDRITLNEDMTEPAKTFAAALILQLSSTLEVQAGDVIVQPNTNASGTVVIDSDSYYVYLQNTSNIFNTTDPIEFDTGLSITQTIVALDSTGYVNAEESLSLYVYDFKTPPASRGEFNLYHPTLGRLERYLVSNVELVQNHAVGLTPRVNDTTPVKSSPGVGSGAVFNVYKLTTGYTVEIVAGGIGYTVGSFIVSGANLGGNDVINDATITIQQVDNGVITEVSITGAIITDDTTPVYSGTIYKLNFTTQAGSSNEGAFSSEGLVANVGWGDFVEYRRNSVFILDDITSVNTLTIRPSTAVIFDENPNVVYRSISFQLSDGVGTPLDINQTAVGFDAVYDYIRLIIDQTHAIAAVGTTLDVAGTPITGGTTKGNTTGDTVLALEPTADENEIFRLNNNLRTPAANRPRGWTVDSLVEAPIITWRGKKFYVFNYRTVQLNNSAQEQVVSPDFYTSTGNLYALVDIVDTGDNINRSYTDSGIPETMVIPLQTVTLRAGLRKGALGDVTVNISTCRATGHDFLDVGTGGFNTSNYPNVIYGVPRAPQQANEVAERGKGRVFYVSTDQNGIFRVGRFFSVDQGTGSVTFEASIALSNVDGIGFKRGVTVTEFSTDSAMTDNATDAVPTESATRGYVDRRLGYDVNGILVPNPLGPSVLAANGSIPMADDLNAAQNKIVNLGFPAANSDAANKDYVDRALGLIDTVGDLRDTTISNIEEADLLIASGYKTIIVDADTIVNGVFGLEETITGSQTGATGIIKDLVITTTLDGDIISIVYEPTSQTDFSSGGNAGQDTIESNIGAEGLAIDGPTDEWMNGKLDADSDVSITVSRTTTTANGNITGRSLEFDIRYKANSIDNSDVAANAAIAQSKLAMNAATTRADASGITQNDLGLAVFNNTEFTATGGFLELQIATDDSTGAGLNKLSWIGNQTALARLDSAQTPDPLGPVTAVSFEDIVDVGGGILHTDIPDADLGAVTRTGSETYDVVGITTTGQANRLVKTIGTGGIHIQELIVGLNDTYRILSVNGTTLSVTTPAQGQILTAQGAPGNVNIRVGGNVDLIGDGSAGNDKTSNSVLKTNSSSYSSSRALASEWIYSHFIEAADEKNAISSGISIGGGSGFSDTNQVAIVVGDTTANNSKAPFIFSRLGVEPDVDAATDNDGYDIGSSTKKYNTVHARYFSGEITGNTSGDLTGDIYSTNGTKILENGANTDGWFIGEVRSNNGTTILDNGTDGTNAVFTGNLTGDVTGTVSDISNHNTNDLPEGSVNFYYTEGRWKTSFDNLNISTNTGTPGATYDVGANTLTITFPAADITSGGGTITDDTQSTAPNNGAFVVTGGVGIGKNLNVGGNTVLGDASTDTTRFKGATTAEQALTVQGQLNTKNIVPDTNNVYTIGTNNSRYNTVYASFFDGVALKAYYADLAENYTADREYEPGTVLVFGGEKEVTVTTTHNDHRVAGVVSTNPAYLMNSQQEGDFVTAVALQGRVPCKVIGRVQKGDLLVAGATPGFAMVNNDAKPGRIIGKALENKNDTGKGIIEVVVGKH